MKCTTCPNVVGDITERDCAFPDCSGGWEEVYLEERNDRLRLQARVIELERQLAKAESKRKEKGLSDG